MFFLASAVIALAGSPAAASVDVKEPNPKTMSQAEIRAFNATLEKGHKYYIRCKRSAPIGSYVARLYSCRTNAQWTASEDIGNQEARDIMEEMKSKSWNTSSPGSGQ
jgi:hypothetical protein